MRVAGFLAAAMCVTACGLTKPAPPWQSDALERSARMLRQLDKLEADLHAQGTETSTYNELVRRHSQAQEIACKVTDDHVAEIHRLAALQERKLEQKRHDRQVRKKKAVAQLTARNGRS